MYCHVTYFNLVQYVMDLNHLSLFSTQKGSDSVKAKQYSELYRLSTKVKSHPDLANLENTAIQDRNY